MKGKEILNYTIVSKIGEGGMGKVYLGEHKYIKQQKVAIKVIHKDMVNDFTINLLKNEAENLAKLNHPNIVHFYDYHIDEDGTIYLIMEDADGISLDEYINTISGLIVEDRICPFFEPILDAVQCAHKHGIIHKDIKPSNIIITKDGIPKILDFGISAILKDEGNDSEGVIMGTPSYMSPEQVKGEKLDTRSDIYSLGVLLHQMLTGNAPYDTTTLTEQEINERVIKEPLPRMKTFYKYVSDKVQKIVDKATAKDKKERYSSCDEMKKALHLAIYPPKISKWVWGSIAAILILAIGAGVWYWDYNRLKIYYYKDYVEQWGIPQGIGEIDEDDAKHLNRMYLFEYRQNKLQRVAHVNSKGKLIEDGESERSDRPIDMTFTYREDGKISSVRATDRNGKVVYIKKYNENLNTATFHYDDEHQTEKTLGASTIGYDRALLSEDNQKGRISRYLIEYDANGYVSVLKYAGFKNVLVSDINNIYGKRYVRDAKGRVIEEHYIGRDGNDFATRWGLGVKKFTYDANDNLIKVVYQTITGEPALDAEDGCAIFELKYDKIGNIVEAYHKSADGTLMIPKREGYSFAGQLLKYDDNGFEIERTFLGEDGKPMIVAIVGFAKWLMEYDANGYLVKRSNYDIDGNLVLDKSGVATYIYINDDRGNPIEQWYYDLKNELVEVADLLVCGQTIKYDDKGNIIQVLCYDKDKNLTTMNNNTNIGFEHKYNNIGLLIEEIYLGADLSPINLNSGVARISYECDDKGNLTRLTNFDISGNIVPDEMGVAIYNYRYDENGNLTTVEHLDKNENLCFNSEGIAKRVSEYDANGFETARYFYGLDNNLIVPSSIGYAGWINKYDERGNIIEEKYIDANKNLAKGSYIIKTKYDNYNNPIETAYFDKNLTPIINEEVGAHRVTTKYNSRNQEIELCYYGIDGKLKCNNNDFAIVQYTYDAFGNGIETSTFDENKKLTLRKDQPYAIQKNEYDVQGRVIRQLYFGIDGKPTEPEEMVPEGIIKYDKRNNIIYIAAADGNGNIINYPALGWAIARYEYDKNNNKVFDAYYDANDKPTTCNEGYHKCISKYNERNQLVEWINYDTSDALTENSYGIARCEISYKDGQPYERKYYNKSNTLIVTQTWNGEDWITERNWKAYIQQQNSYLPIDLGPDNGNLVVRKISITGANSCTFVFAVPATKEEIEEAGLVEAYKNVAKMIVNNVMADFPRVSVKIEIYDTNSKLL